MGDLALNGAFALFFLMTLFWMISVYIKDASIVDRIWGLTFVLQAAVYAFYAEPRHTRAFILLILVAIWGFRLSWYIHQRNKGDAEDYRYQAMRARHGEAKFWWYSFLSVFLLQGLISFVVGAPLLVNANFGVGVPLGWLDYLALVFWVIGFAFEAGGDYQLKNFKKDPNNKGKLLTTGFWKLTRHPNYFGDALQWWAIFVFTISVPFGFLSIIGPIVMNFFLVKVSGVALLEKDLVKKKPEYKNYIESTPAFIPKISKLWQ